MSGRIAGRGRGEKYIFLPQYPNRKTASQIVQRQFRELMKRAGVEDDPISGMKHTIYSLRHTAICMRIVLSDGKVNIFNLAKNAGTSVDQIERFYARHLPLSRELARNLHTFGSKEQEDWYGTFTCGSTGAALKISGAITLSERACAPTPPAHRP